MDFKRLFLCLNFGCPNQREGGGRVPQSVYCGNHHDGQTKISQKNMLGNQEECLIEKQTVCDRHKLLVIHTDCR